MIADYHMHLRADRAEGEEADHSVEAVERYFEAARARGVDEIGLTEHVYYFRETRALWRDPYQLDRCRHGLGAYCDAVLEGRGRGLPVRLGLEVDFVPGREDELDEILAPYPWDYLLGSVHWIDGLSVDSQPGLWEALPVADVWRLYFETLAAAATSRLFDVLSHPDLAKIFGRRPGAELVAELYELAAAAIGESGVAVEISTAGLHKPVGELYPAGELLRACRAHGVPITLASDAHQAEHVGRDLALAVRHARDSGYETVSAFDRRERRQEPLG